MRQFIAEVKAFFKKGDVVLLLLLLITSAYGLLAIASATNYRGNVRFVTVQALAIAMGVLAYIIMSSLDIELFTSNYMWLVAFNSFLLLLLVPFGTDLGSGNKSWLDIPLLPIDIQPAEICKITFILIMASVMSRYQSSISGIPSVISMVVQLGLLVGLNMVVSKDMGVSLIFVFIFIGMAWCGGVSAFWFLLAIGSVVAVAPFAWEFVLSQHQKNRIEVLFNPNLDPDGINERFHSVRSLRSLTGGGFSGQGLFNGTRTQKEELFAQHTDYIFSAIGEELGFLGCTLVLVLMALIVARCIQIGRRSPDYTRRLVCYGAASALIFQVMINVGMCLGVMPVIGLTLPFMSYGGSSVVTLFAMLGMVSGVCARPVAPTHERYIRPYR